MKRLFLACSIAAAAAMAGPYDQPYSIITADTAKSANPNLLPVIVNRVDGENTLENRAVVAPGSHKVTVDLPPRKGFHTATQQTFELATLPCVRYNVAAKLDSPAAQRWTPVVRSVERIGECTAKWGKTPAQGR